MFTSKIEDAAYGLPADTVDICKKDARRDGVFAGFTAALISGEYLSVDGTYATTSNGHGGLSFHARYAPAVVIGTKLFRFNRNTTIACGALTGVLSGWQFTQGFTLSNIALARAKQQARREAESGDAESVPSSTVSND
ncbi:uncharacterized protein LAESUDRAFT_675645 [Laetiporus sulphureus 93-53]|uniref:Uncharacterized protein n=1 Tax=Laetiporus sulphureus 93-53 TaxID=1314785 RepID=A0A165FJD1_9APHY|nr:uncharacterized protein LAESUDRAFT_675645 [Laetiporus sulphureus 93-53]KZT09060.1 hypothetical protein LAESUDRAFT_675645 [Laetiporus sulphureus 93-53]